MTSWDIATVTSIGTGVAKTRINGDQPITKPTQAQCLIEIVPYYVSTGAYTAAQTLLLETAVESPSVNLLPKRVINPPQMGGLGTFAAVMAPLLESYRTNTPLTDGATEQFNIFGQAQVANTVAPVMGCALHYSQAKPVMPERFYLKPDDETSSGIVATTVAGNSFTINDGAYIEDLYSLLVPTTVTASESLIGDMLFSSNDFENSMPLRVPFQPVAAGLGAAAEMLMPAMTTYHNTHMGIKSTCLVSTTLRLSEALTVAGNFIAGVGYTKQ